MLHGVATTDSTAQPEESISISTVLKLLCGGCTNKRSWIAYMGRSVRKMAGSFGTERVALMSSLQKKGGNNKS